MMILEQIQRWKAWIFIGPGRESQLTGEGVRNFDMRLLLVQ
jgi:hypothetical protein